MIAAGLGAAAGFIGGERQNVANARMAREQMAFQERMASTSWQRGVEDMKRAGLNPALAYQKGGADSPGGAMATMEDSLSRGASSARDTAAIKSRLASEQVGRVATAAQADAAAAQSEKTRAETRSIDMMRQQQFMNLVEQMYLMQANARESNVRGTDLFNRSPLLTELLREELNVGRPITRELDRSRIRLTDTTARESAQRIELTDRMTPDEWSAYLQKNMLPFVNSAAAAAGGFGAGLLSRNFRNRRAFNSGR